jgi:hypothetical protein
VTWGELNRLQRIDESRGEQFDDARASLPIPGVSGRDGAVFTFYAIRLQDRNASTELPARRM